MGSVKTGRIDFPLRMQYRPGSSERRVHALQTKIITAGIVREEERFLIAQRLSDDEHGLTWEFPGGGQEDGEDPRMTLARELLEELGIVVEVGKVLETLYHRYPTFDMLLIFYACRIVSGRPTPIECAQVRWVNRPELIGYSFMPADRLFIEGLVRGEYEPST